MDQPVNQLAKGPHDRPATRFAQSYIVPAVGKADAISARQHTVTSMSKDTASQPQNMTAGPPFCSDWPYSGTIPTSTLQKLEASPKLVSLLKCLLEACVRPRAASLLALAQ